jgi:hypothetical protein
MESLSYISVANNKLTGTIPAEWGGLKKLRTIGLAYNELKGSLAPLGQMPFLSVIFVRNNSFSGPVPGLPKSVSAFYVDGNVGLDSVDIATICDSAPPGGFNEGGCNFDWPDARAVNSCCMKGDSWSTSILQLDCLKPCFAAGPKAPTPAPPAPSDTYTCLVPQLQCKAVAGSGGQFPTNATCVAECHAPESYTCLVPQFQCAPGKGTSGQYPSLKQCDAKCKVPTPAPPTPPPTPKPTPKPTPPPTPKPKPTPPPTPPPTPAPKTYKCGALTHKCTLGDGVFKSLDTCNEHCTPTPPPPTPPPPTPPHQTPCSGDPYCCDHGTDADCASCPTQFVNCDYTQDGCNAPPRPGTWCA